VVRRDTLMETAALAEIAQRRSRTYWLLSRLVLEAPSPAFLTELCGALNGAPHDAGLPLGHETIALSTAVNEAHADPSAPEALDVERTRLLRVAQGAEKVGGVVMMGIPIAAALAQTPVAGVLVLVAGMATMGISTLVHLVTLPVEWDASFRRALPVLQQGNYLSPEDEQGARRILTAAALTYVAASLASLLNLWRWIAFLRR
jgi:hypothetical protein